MKKNFPFSLIVSHTVFTGFSCNTVYQSRSLHYKTYGINNEKQKEAAGLTISKSPGYRVNKRTDETAGIAKKTSENKQPEGIPGNLTGDKLKKKECCNMVICFLQPGYPSEESNKASDDILLKGTNNMDLKTGRHLHTFFVNLLTCKKKKGDKIIVNEVGWEGIVSDRLDFEFTKFSGKKLAKYHTISVSQKTDG